MRSMMMQTTRLQKELILYSLNLEKAIDINDQYGVLYYDVLLQFSFFYW